ncbi:MAG: response regulator [bacterium]
MRQKALDIEQITRLCHVPSTTVLRWLQKHNLKTIEIPGAQPKVWRSDLMQFLESIQEPVPKELVLIDILHIVVLINDANLKEIILDELKDLLPNARISAQDNAFEAGIATYESNPHILILDLDTPGMENYRILADFKQSKRFRCTRIITIGSADKEADSKKILQSGAEEFFVKPLRMIPFKDSITFQVNELL